MRFLPFLLFFLAPSVPATVPAPVAQAAACLPPRTATSEPDSWLLLATLAVCVAGRLAAQPRC